ncbi:hypothetical protein PR048_026494 [Dryococelus australis]|uniref:Uncharacterized protein n=1 Tax=Dryococelus australis TaxID=614101 RepID=A0ABQ9GLH7_9NEOP|nr:hypothetical protein PR048_026494 [Dryococelus australis]
MHQRQSIKRVRILRNGTVEMPAPTASLKNSPALQLNRLSPCRFASPSSFLDRREKLALVPSLSCPGFRCTRREAGGPCIKSCCRCVEQAAYEGAWAAVPNSRAHVPQTCAHKPRPLSASSSVLRKEEGLLEGPVVRNPSQHSPEVISENHGRQKSGMPDRESNPDPSECESMGGNPEYPMITESEKRVWHCSSESTIYIQNPITPLDCQRIKEYVTLSEDCEASSIRESTTGLWLTGGCRNAYCRYEIAVCWEMRCTRFDSKVKVKWRGESFQRLLTSRSWERRWNVGAWEMPESTRRSAASSGTMPTYEGPGRGEGQADGEQLHDVHGSWTVAMVPSVQPPRRVQEFLVLKTGPRTATSFPCETADKELPSCQLASSLFARHPVGDCGHPQQADRSSSPSSTRKVIGCSRVGKRGEPREKQGNGATVVEWLEHSPPTKAIRVRFLVGSVSGFSHLGIVPGRCCMSASFLEDRRFPPPSIPGAAPYPHNSPLISSQDHENRPNLSIQPEKSRQITASSSGRVTAGEFASNQIVPGSIPAGSLPDFCMRELCMDDSVGPKSLRRNHLEPVHLNPCCRRLCLFDVSAAVVPSIPLSWPFLGGRPLADARWRLIHLAGIWPHDKPHAGLYQASENKVFEGSSPTAKPGTSNAGTTLSKATYRKRKEKGLKLPLEGQWQGVKGRRQTSKCTVLIHPNEGEYKSEETKEKLKTMDPVQEVIAHTKCVPGGEGGSASRG